MLIFDKNYPDEIISLARWYYEQGHLYDEVFTWTGDQRVDEYRQGNVWEWWGDGVPSLAEISDKEPTEPIIINTKGDVNLDNAVTVLDIIALQRYLLKLDTFTEEQFHRADMDENSSANVIDLALLKKSLMK